LALYTPQGFRAVGVPHKSVLGCVDLDFDQRLDVHVHEQVNAVKSVLLVIPFSKI